MNLIFWPWVALGGAGAAEVVACVAVGVSAAAHVAAGTHGVADAILAADAAAVVAGGAAAAAHLATGSSTSADVTTDVREC